MIHARMAIAKVYAMSFEWNHFPPELQVSVSREALKRARHIVAAQAKLLADQMEQGTLPSFDGPDALRLLVMILGDDLAEAPSPEMFQLEPSCAMPLPGRSGNEITV